MPPSTSTRPSRTTGLKIPGIAKLAAIASQVVGEARHPRGGYAVTRLVKAPRAGRPTSPRQAGVPAVAARQQLNDQRAFSVRPGGQDDTIIHPLHGVTFGPFNSIPRSRPVDLSSRPCRKPAPQAHDVIR